MYTTALTQLCELGYGSMFMTLKFQFTQMKYLPTHSRMDYPTDSWEFIVYITVYKLYYETL